MIRMFTTPQARKLLAVLRWQFTGAIINSLTLLQALVPLPESLCSTHIPFVLALYDTSMVVTDLTLCRKCIYNRAVQWLQVFEGSNKYIGINRGDHVWAPKLRFLQ